MIRRAWLASCVAVAVAAVGLGAPAAPPKKKPASAKVQKLIKGSMPLPAATKAAVVQQLIGIKPIGLDAAVRLTPRKLWEPAAHLDLSRASYLSTKSDLIEMRAATDGQAPFATVRFKPTQANKPVLIDAVVKNLATWGPSTVEIQALAAGTGGLSQYTFGANEVNHLTYVAVPKNTNWQEVNIRFTAGRSMLTSVEVTPTR